MVLVMEMLGPSLEELLNFTNRKFSLKTSLMITDQLISRIEGLHKNLYIHRDIKPENFLLGIGANSRKIFLIDFGLSKKYVDTQGNHVEHIKSGKSLTGTARYASVNAHTGMEQSRRDDIESISYLSIYFLQGLLPWQGLNGPTKAEKYRMIFECKSKTTSEILCKDCMNMRELIEYCKLIKFNETPDYPKIHTMLQTVSDKENITMDSMYDWIYEAAKPIKKNIFLKEAEYMEMQRKVLRGQAYFSSMPGSSIERLSLIKDDYFDNIFHIDSTKNMIPRTKSNEHIGVDEEDEKREKVKGDCIII